MFKKIIVSPFLQILAMPFIHTYVPQTCSREHRALIVSGIHNALVIAIGMPEDELFNMVHPYAPEDFYFSRSFNGIRRSEQLVVIEISMRRGRSDAMKRALYQRISENITKSTGIDVRDIFIVTHENDYSDWSVGNGQFAMAIVQQRGGDGDSNGVG